MPILNLFQHIMRVWCERFEPFYVDVKGVQEVMASRKPEALWFMAHQAFMKVCPRARKCSKYSIASFFLGRTQFFYSSKSLYGKTFPFAKEIANDSWLIKPS